MTSSQKFLIDADGWSCVIANCVVFFFASLAFRKTQDKALGLLAISCVVGLLLTIALHTLGMPGQLSREAYLGFRIVYRTVFVISTFLWMISMVLLIKYATRNNLVSTPELLLVKPASKPLHGLRWHVQASNGTANTLKSLFQSFDSSALNSDWMLSKVAGTNEAARKLEASSDVGTSITGLALGELLRASPEITSGEFVAYDGENKERWLLIRITNSLMCEVFSSDPTALLKLRKNFPFAVECDHVL